MAGYNPKGNRARSSEPGTGAAVPIDAMLNATGEHAAATLDPTPTPPEGVEITDLDAASLPPEASRQGKRNTEDTDAVVVDPVEVEPVDQAAADDPQDPTPHETPLPQGDEPPLAGDPSASDLFTGDSSVEDDLPAVPARREPLVPAAAPPDEDDRRLLIAGGTAVGLAIIVGGMIAWRRRNR